MNRSSRIRGNDKSSESQQSNISPLSSQRHVYRVQRRAGASFGGVLVLVLIVLGIGSFAVTRRLEYRAAKDQWRIQAQTSLQAVIRELERTRQTADALTALVSATTSRFSLVPGWEAAARALSDTASFYSPLILSEDAEDFAAFVSTQFNQTDTAFVNNSHSTPIVHHSHDSSHLLYDTSSSLDLYYNALLQNPTTGSQVSTLLTNNDSLYPVSRLSSQDIGSIWIHVVQRNDEVGILF